MGTLHAGRIAQSEGLSQVELAGDLIMRRTASDLSPACQAPGIFLPLPLRQQWLLPRDIRCAQHLPWSPASQSRSNRLQERGVAKASATPDGRSPTPAAPNKSRALPSRPSLLAA